MLWHECFCLAVFPAVIALLPVSMHFFMLTLFLQLYVLVLAPAPDGSLFLLCPFASVTVPTAL